MQTYAVDILINSGCTSSVMDLDWARGLKFNYQKMHKPMVFRNVDETINTRGSFQYSTNMRLFIGGHVENMQFILGKIHGHKIILGHDWLMLHNLKIDWNNKHMNFTQCEKKQKQYPDTPCHILRTSTPMPDWAQKCFPKIHTRNYPSQDLGLTVS